MRDKKIAVVMGGPGAEREVSLNTGKAVLTALEDAGYDCLSIDLNPAAFVDELRDKKIDIVFNALHGQYGEDGLMQGLLEFLSVPYTGSGVFASAAAMDKAVSKHLFLAANIPTPASRLYHKNQFKNVSDMAGEIINNFGMPVVVKPNAQGSSIGVSIVNDATGLEDALYEVFKYSLQVLVEEFIDGKELTVAILGSKSPEVLPVIEIVPNSGKYDYHSKYTKGATNYLVPAPIDDTATEKTQKAALDAYNLLGCRGVGRVDIMLDKSGSPYVLEVNTMPGMTATSLVPKAAAAAGISFQELCERILLSAVEEG
jgi:D-alanine--D-alanine ligase